MILGGTPRGRRGDLVERVTTPTTNQQREKQPTKPQPVEAAASLSDPGHEVPSSKGGLV